MKIVRSLQKRLPPEKIFRRGKGAAARCCLGRLESFVERVEKENRFVQPTIGSALAVGKNLKHEQRKSYMDTGDGIMCEIL